MTATNPTGNVGDAMPDLPTGPTVAATEHPMHRAAQSGDCGALLALLQSGRSTDERDEHGATPLHYAAAINRVEVVRLLLDRGANVNQPDNAGRVPLMVAVEECSARAVDLLIDQTDLTAVDTSGSGLLHVAARAGNRTAVELLLARGMHPGARNDYLLTPADVARCAKHSDLAGQLAHIPDVSASCVEPRRHRQRSCGRPRTAGEIPRLA